MSISSKRQVEDILARFPEPVTLYFSRRRILLMLPLYVGLVAFCFWLLFADYPWEREYMSGPRDAVMASVSILFWSAFALRAATQLLSPGTASLKLDADGFEIRHVFRRTRTPWREVSDFRTKTKYFFPFRIGGPVEQIVYEDLAAGPETSEAKAPCVLPDLYGQPRIRRADLVELMNEWRRRAIAQPVSLPSNPSTPPRSGMPAISGALQ